MRSFLVIVTLVAAAAACVEAGDWPANHKPDAKWVQAYNKLQGNEAIQPWHLLDVIEQLAHNLNRKVTYEDARLNDAWDLSQVCNKYALHCTSEREQLYERLRKKYSESTKRTLPYVNYCFSMYELDCDED